MRKIQTVCCFVVFSLLAAHHFAFAADPAHPEQPSVAPAEAISKLKEGRFPDEKWVLDTLGARLK